MSTKADAGYPFAPRFWWEFFRADSETLDRLSKAIRNYSGVVGWVFGPPLTNNGTCLVAAKRGVDEFVGYPPLNRAMEQPSGPTEEFIDQALSDIPNLCSHLERYLGLEQLPAKSFDPGLIAPRDPPSLDSVPVDFVERGMHVKLGLSTGVVEKIEREGSRVQVIGVCCTSALLRRNGDKLRPRSCKEFRRIGRLDQHPIRFLLLSKN